MKFVYFAGGQRRVLARRQAAGWHISLAVLWRALLFAFGCVMAPVAVMAQVVPASPYLLDPTTPVGPRPTTLCARAPTSTIFTNYNLIGTTTGSTNPVFPFSPGAVYQSAGVVCTIASPPDPARVFFTAIPSNFTALGAAAPAGGGNEALYGTPHSIQFAAFQQALNLADIDVEGPTRFTDEGDADTIGVAYTHFGSNGVVGNRLEGRFEKSWRPFKGSRSRAMLDVRAQGVWIGSHLTGAAIVTGAVEIKVKPNWSLSGRIGAGGVVSDSFFGKGGGIYTAAATSRWRAAQLGRGELVVGNSVIFTGVTAAGGAKNVGFRNGIAYQFPLKGLIGGRQTSLRLSYVNTKVVGDPVPYDLYHEVAVNFGVRLRQDEQKSRFESFRVGLLYTRAARYNAGTLTIGYRF